MEKQKASLLSQTLSQAKRDTATVTPDGASRATLIEGVSIRRLTTHVDNRGAVTELFDPRWGFHPDPMVFCYMFTVRPGVVKGWGLHRKHHDRYVIIQGELELVLYDVRPNSSTCGDVCCIRLSEFDRSLVNIPIEVWHADYNFGSRDAVVVNFPTMQYDHQDPDKYRLPIDTPLIPYEFPPSARGG
jgi:dTDP-4-dehydrorhamnose 3,5-epimerase